MSRERFHHRHMLYLLSSMVISYLLLFSATYAYAATPKLNQSSITLSTYHTCQLKVSHSKKVKWSSSNPAIAKVSKSGLVTANASGTAKIYAKVNNRKLSCKVKVVAFDRHIERAAYGKNTMQLLIGKDVSFSDFRSGNFMNGTEFSYFQCSYNDQNSQKHTCYVYIYSQEENSTQQLNVPTELYGNLVVKVDSMEMERMMQDRSQKISASKISKCLSILKKTEQMKYHAGSSFKETHNWMKL